MLKYIKNYVSKYEKSLNISLMRKEFDMPLVEFIKDAWLSLQIVDGIDILGFDYTERESEIDINNYIFKRNRGLKREEKFDYKYIDDTCCGLLTTHIKLSVEVKDTRTNEMVTQEQVIKKSMLIPLQDEDGLYYLKGQHVYLILQLVEKSTYTAANLVILKSLMPFAIRRYIINATDTAGTDYKIPYYTIDLFHKDVEIMAIFASKGLDFAIQFSLDTPYLVLNMVEEEDKEDIRNIYFEISSKLYLKVNRELFLQYTYVQSVVGGILQISSNHLTLAKINDKELWLKRLGNGNIQQGQNLLKRANRLLDETIGKILKLDIYNKHDVISIIRWMAEEYNDLRMKDNMHLKNKRVRCNEIIECLFTLDCSFRLNRLMSLGKKATLENYREVFSFPGDILIQKIHSSGICRYNDVINDMDFFSKFKYTIKGPQSLGNKNSNNIGVRYRGIHYSFLGHIDLTVCGNSDREIGPA